EPRHAVEQYGEVAVTRAADLRGDLGDRELGAAKQPLRAFDAPLEDVAMRRDAGPFTDRVREMPGRQRPGLRERGERQVAAQVVAAVLPRPAQLVQPQPHRLRP